MKRIAFALALALVAPLPAPVVAHPHMFMDAGFEVIFDAQNRLTHIRVTWVYDDFYSLMITEDFNADADFDGVMTPEEKVNLTGFDAKWDPEFNGHLEVRLDGQLLRLTGPSEPTADMEAGRIRTTHLRDVIGAPLIMGDMLSIKAFDESYFTAYEVTQPVTITGGIGCASTLIEPDINAEMAAMQAHLLRLDINADLEENDIPMIGAAFATEVQVICQNS